MEEAWRLFSSKSWPQGVWRMDRQGSWQTISITSNSLVTEVPIIQGGRSLPHHSTTLGNCIGLINIYGRFSLSWKCNVFRYHCNYFVVLSGVGNCMGLESCGCHDEKSVLRMPTALYALRLVASEPKVSSEQKTIRNSIMTVQCPWVTRFLFYGN